MCTLGGRGFGPAVGVLLVALSLATTAPAQDHPEVVPIVVDVTRLDAWSFFEPPPTGGDPDYTLLGNRATLGARVKARRVEFQASFQYAQLLGVPRRADGPGPLGPGALFFAAALNASAYQLYFKSMSLRLKDVPRGLAVEIGRMAYESGEGTPLAGRLIGNAEWTIFERAFDGLRLDSTRPGWQAHASFFMPTQGAFEESANPRMGRLHLATGSWTRGAAQLFAHHCRDTRGVRSRPDNMGVAVARADIAIQTFGAAWSPAWTPAGGGVDATRSLDVTLWGAWQRGQWYEQRHRAFSASAGIGYRWPRARWAPAVSVGALYASGDGASSDSRHETFFPMVPTTTPALLGATFAQMNLRDFSAGFSLRPRGRLRVSAEAHRLSLANAADRWYSGTGATALSGSYFGFSTRGSRLATGLGTYVQIAAETPVHRYWTLRASAGVLRGGDVVRRQFAGRWLRVFALESTLRR